MPRADDVSPGMVATVECDGRTDEVAVEDPLEIRVDGEPIAVTMRTPGHDEELALGFLRGEGLIDRAHEAGPTADFAANIVDVSGPLLRDPGRRRFYTTSSCGICGRGALEEVAVLAPVASGGAAGIAAGCSPTCPSASSSRPSPAPADSTRRASSTATASL